jgi:hypothetical protein
MPSLTDLSENYKTCTLTFLHPISEDPYLLAYRVLVHECDIPAVVCWNIHCSLSNLTTYIKPF